MNPHGSAKFFNFKKEKGKPPEGWTVLEGNIVVKLKRKHMGFYTWVQDNAATAMYRNWNCESEEIEDSDDDSYFKSFDRVVEEEVEGEAGKPRKRKRF